MVRVRNIFASAVAAIIVAAIPVTFSFAMSYGPQYQLYQCWDYYAGSYYSYSPCPTYYQPTYYSYPTYSYSYYYDPYYYSYPTYYYYPYYGYNYNYNYNYNGWI